MGERPYVIDQMISAKAIAARVEELAADITEYFKGTDKLVVVGLLRGSFVFIADLVRELGLPVEVDFLEASSYGDSMRSSREVRILKDIRGEVAGRDVLVVEDIVDTGFTLHHVRKVLEAREPRRLCVCALLDKPSRREVDVKATWTGFEIPDEFVVGYGLDVASERKMLRVARRIGEIVGITVRTTYLGAHALPPQQQKKPNSEILGFPFLSFFPTNDRCEACSRWMNSLFIGEGPLEAQRYSEMKETDCSFATAATTGKTCRCRCRRRHGKEGVRLK